MHKKILETKDLNLRSISVTTSSPPDKTKEELVNEMIDIAKKIKVDTKGKDIPIGMSLQTPSVDHLRRLKEAGVSEMRLNLETYNRQLAESLMPNKKIDDILKSIEHAVEIFGKEKVSSNLIIGLGETDDDILQGVEVLSEMGALSTLYPYDYIGAPSNPTIEPPDEKFKRPSAERIFNLAVEHKKILEKYGLDPLAAKTMCCSCAASHLYPGRDI